MTMSTRALCATAFVLTLTSAAEATVKGPTVDDQVQAACYDDVQRLCKDAMPDEDKVATCMKQQKSKVSAKCTAAYKASRS